MLPTWEYLNIETTVDGNVNWCSHWKTLWRFLNEIKIDLHNDPEIALLLGVGTGTATLENCVEVPQRVNNRSVLRPSNCTAGDYPKDTDAVKCQDTRTPMFLAAMFTID